MRFRHHLFAFIIIAFALNSCKDKGNPVNGGGPEPIPLPKYFDYPAWHPGGEWIAVQHADSLDTDGDGTRDQHFAGIWLVHAQTGQKQPLIQGFGLPAWSPDGRKLALVAGAQIWTVDVVSLQPALIDTGSLKQLTTEGRNFFPAWSPDGEWIAYDNTICGTALEPPPPNSCGILIMRNDGTSRRFLARGRYPHWSVDGSSLLYVGLRAEIFRVMVSDTSQVVRLTSFNQIDPYARHNSFPKYSPDGTKIVFQSQAYGEAPQIWVMNADGRNRLKLTNTGGEMPSWFPDGTKIVYIGYKQMGQYHPQENGTVWVMNADGTNKRQLTFGPSPQ